MKDEELAYIMEYLWQQGVDKERVKKAVDIWYRIKEESNETRRKNK